MVPRSKPVIFMSQHLAEVFSSRTQHLHNNNNRQESEIKFALLLHSCIKARDLQEGQKIHQQIVNQQLQDSRELGNLLVTMYGKCGCIDDARRAFSLIRDANVYSWNLMTVALVENGRLSEAADLFQKQPRKNMVSFNTMIAAYAQNGHLRDAEELFDRMLEKDICSWNTMLNAYILNNQLHQARQMFDRMRDRDVVTWNSLIAALAQCSRGREALFLFRNMELEGQKADRITILCAVNACATEKLSTEVKQVHWRATEFISDTKVGNALVNMFGKCSMISDAKRAFDRLPKPDVISWTTMFTAYALKGELLRARDLFNKMPHRTVVSWNCMLLAYSQSGKTDDMMEIFDWMIREPDIQPDESSLVTVLDGCANTGSLEEGIRAHKFAESSGLQSDVKVGNALLAVYTKCGRMDTARQLFESASGKNVVSWTTMISAYAQNGDGGSALEMLHRMDLEGVHLNEVTLISAIDACVCATALAEGRRLHRRSTDTGWFTADAKVGNAVINLYGRCGRTEESWRTFESMIGFRNRITWNAMIAALAQNGHCARGVDVFMDMLLEGFPPDEITFTSVLSICAHSGLRVEFGERFVSVSSDHGVAYDVSHYVCVVDLLGRLGHLQEAEELISVMPFEPTVSVWTTLLAGCGMHKGCSERAANAAEQAIGLDPGDPGLYVLLANVYFDAGKVGGEVRGKGDEEIGRFLREFASRLQKTTSFRGRFMREQTC